MSNPEPTPTKIVCALCPHPEDHDIHNGPADTENLHLWEPIEVPDEPAADEPCGACGGPEAHSIHHGEDLGEHEAHEYIALSEATRRVEGQLRALTDENVQRAKRLARGEPPMQLDSASMSALRLETILNHVLPPGTPQRLQFEFYFQGEVSKALDDAFSEQAKLRLGVRPTGRTTPKGLHLGGR